MTISTLSHSPELTQRQGEVLQVIRNHIEGTGAPPTRAEIARQLGFRSVNAAEDHLKALARKGAIVLSPGTSRGIQLSEKHGLGLPIITRFQAGKPICAETNIDGRLRVQVDHFKSKPDFLYQMQGISLIGAGIKEGDLLAVHKTHEAQVGNLVLAQVNQQLQTRRYTIENQQIILRAENPDFPALTINPEHNLVIEGIIVGIIRTTDL
jgi:repressor LexA